MFCGGLDPAAREARRSKPSQDEIESGYITPGCGAEIDLPDSRQDPATWDVETKTIEGVEFVVARSVVARCSQCGYEGDENKIDEVLDKPVPFDEHEPKMEWARAVAGGRA